MQKQDEILKALLEINRSISSGESKELLNLILKNALKLTQANRGDIRSIDPDTKELVIRESVGQKVTGSSERFRILTLFSMDRDAQLEGALNKNKKPIPEELKDAFKTKAEKRITLSKKAFLEKEDDDRWRIIDGEEHYVITREDKKLDIYPISIGITGWVVVDKKPILVPDVTVDKRYIACIKGTKSELAVPMLYEDRVIGVLNVERDRPSAFDKKDIEPLEALANQAAIAIENENRIERQNKIINVFNRIGSKITTKPELDPVVREITKGVYDIVEVDIPLIYLYDPEKGDFSETVVFGDISKAWERGCQPRPDGSGMKAIEERGIVFARGNDINRFPREKGVEITVAVPLFFNGDFAVMYMHFLEETFTEDEDKNIKNLLDAPSKKISEIIGKFEFHKVPQNELENVKEELAKKIAESKIVDKIKGIADADIVLIYLCDLEKKKFTNVIFAELSKSWKQCRPRSKEKDGVDGAAQKAIKAKRLIIAYENGDTDINPFPKRKGVKTTAAYPLWLEDKILGVLYMHFLAEHNFTDDEMRAIEMFGVHAATIIDMTNTSENLRKHSEMREALLEMRRDITSNFEKVVSKIAEGIAKITPECTLNLYLYHQDYPEDKRFEFVSGVGTENEIRLGHILPRLGPEGVGTRVVENVSKHREPEYIIIEDVQDPNSGGSPSARKEKVKTTACFPLKFEGQVIGLLYLHFLETHHFSSDEIEIFKLLSDQAAIAIENAKSEKKLEVSEKKRGQTYEELFGTELLNCLEELRGTNMGSQDKGGETEEK